MVSQYPHLAREPLSIKDVPEFQDLYTDLTVSVEPAKDNSEEKDVNQGNFLREPPYEDPFELQPEIPNKLGLMPIPDSETESYIEHQIRNLRERKDDIKEPTIHLRSLMYIQDGGPSRREELEDFVDKYSTEHSTNVKVATYSLRALRSAYRQMENPRQRQDCVESGHFALILKLMTVQPKSCKLQVAGFEAFFEAMGSYGVDESLPLPPVMERGRLVNAVYRKVIKTTLLSLTTAPEHIDLQTLLKGMECIVKYYHTSMPDQLQR